MALVSQLLRSATSIGANAEEAIGIQSKKDFLSKISIVYKEARETNYWLKLIKTINNQNKLKNIGTIQINIKKQIHYSHDLSFRNS